MNMVVVMVLVAGCFFSVAVNEYSDAVGEYGVGQELLLRVPNLQNHGWVVVGSSGGFSSGREAVWSPQGCGGPGPELPPLSDVVAVSSGFGVGMGRNMSCL